MRRLICLAACSLLLVWLSACGKKPAAPVVEEPSPPVSDVSAAPVPDVPAAPAGPHPSAEEVVRAMSDYFKGLQSVEFDFRQTLLLQFQGQEQKMAVEMAIAAERPNHLAIRVSAGSEGINVVSDGKNLSLHIPSEGKYTQSEAPASFSEMVKNPMLSGMSGAGMAFLNLLTDDPYQAFLENTTAVEYVAEEAVDGRAMHHLRLSQEELDRDCWITADEKPVLYRLSFDMSAAMAARMPPGRAGEIKAINEQTYTNWRLDAKPAAEAFVFTPPADAEKVDSFFDMPQEEKSPLLGQPAPEIQLPLLDGAEFSLASYRGKNVVMIDFWATWCGPCVEEMPALAEVAAEYAGQGVVFCALNQGEETEAIQKFLEEKALNIMVGLDSSEPADSAGAAYGVQGIPTLVLIDKSGTVQSVHVGYRPDIKDVLREELDTLLAGKTLVEEPPAAEADPSDKPADAAPSPDSP
jgi:hypothetical protein